jgi:hypothetical protein
MDDMAKGKNIFLIRSPSFPLAEETVNERSPDRYRDSGKLTMRDK